MPSWSAKRLMGASCASKPNPLLPCCPLPVVVTCHRSTVQPGKIAAAGLSSEADPAAARAAPLRMRLRQPVQRRRGRLVPRLRPRRRRGEAAQASGQWLRLAAARSSNVSRTGMFLRSDGGKVSRKAAAGGTGRIDDPKIGRAIDVPCSFLELWQGIWRK